VILMPVDTWTNYKALITAKGFVYQWAEYDNRYEIFAAEVIFVWQITLRKDGGADVVDFETNYKSAGNKSLSIGGVHNNTLPDLTVGQASPVRITPKRDLHINLRDVAGNEIGSPSNPLSTTTVLVSELAPTTAVLKQNEIAIATRTESDLVNTTYTVAAGKKFKLTSFGGSYDTQAPMYLRLKKQTGGAGAFVTIFRVTLKQHGQDESNFDRLLPLGLNIGVAGDVFKITYESGLARGSLWAGYTGVEF